jgi:hypothetical protein
LGALNANVTSLVNGALASAWTDLLPSPAPPLGAVVKLMFTAATFSAFSLVSVPVSGSASFNVLKAAVGLVLAFSA